MVIREIYIRSFGILVDRRIRPGDGLNVIEGVNGSGKSTLAAFIKFVFYGLSAAPRGNETVSERERYVNGDFAPASGYIVAECRGGKYRIERSMHAVDEGGRDIYREKIRVIDLSDGSDVSVGASPGEYFFGFPEAVFMQSAFVKDVDSARINGIDLKSSLENLMTSGDEKINTRRAVRSFHSAEERVRAEAAELEEERDRLKALLSDCKDVSKRVVDLEGALADVASKREKRENEAKELSALCAAYEEVRAGTKKREIAECESRIRETVRELEALDSAIDGEFAAKIDICESTVIETENDIEQLAEKKADLEAKLENRDTEPPEEAESVSARAKKIKRSETFCLAAGCTLAVFTLIALAALLVPPLRTRFAQTGYLGLLIGVTAAFALLAGTSFFLFSRFFSKYEELLSSWGADDEESLEGAVMEKKESYKYTLKLIEGIKKIDDATEEAITRHDREIDRGMEYGEMLGVAASENVFEVLAAAREAAREVCTKRAELIARLGEEKGKYSALSADVGDGSERSGAEDSSALDVADRERILSMTKEDYNRLVRARDFAESAAESLAEREASLEKELSTVGSAGRSPCIIAGRISAAESRLAEVMLKRDALAAARAALDAADEQMRRDVMPRVVSDASAMMRRVTSGGCSGISAGDDLDFSAELGGKTLPVGVLSEGTKDLAYICLRTALVKEIFTEDTPPMIFDECFARLDRSRLSATLGALSSEGAAQSFVFTCRTEDIADAAGAVVIRL